MTKNHGFIPIFQNSKSPVPYAPGRYLHLLIADKPLPHGIDFQWVVTALPVSRHDDNCGRSNNANPRACHEAAAHGVSPASQALEPGTQVGVEFHRNSMVPCHLWHALALACKRGG